MDDDPITKLLESMTLHTRPKIRQSKWKHRQRFDTDDDDDDDDYDPTSCNIIHENVRTEWDSCLFQTPVSNNISISVNVQEQPFQIQTKLETAVRTEDDEDAVDTDGKNDDDDLMRLYVPISEEEQSLNSEEYLDNWYEWIDKIKEGFEETENENQSEYEENTSEGCGLSEYDQILSDAKDQESQHPSDDSFEYDDFDGPDVNDDVQNSEEP